MTRTILLVLAKAPRAGQVKTRLCPPATPRQAAKIAAAALLDTLDCLGAVRGAFPVIALSGDLAGAESETALACALRGIPVLPQRDGTLGERIAAAHTGAARLFPGCPVLQIGMDTPQVTPELLEECRDRLLRPGVAAVLGPAEDGGWWLLGLRDPRDADKVGSVPTSRPDTGARTRLALRQHGLPVASVPALADVDTMTIARAVASTLPASRFATAVGAVG